MRRWIALAAIAFTGSLLVAQPPGRAEARGMTAVMNRATSKACDTQATEQKLQGDDRTAFMQACLSHQATETQGQMQGQIKDSQEIPTSGSTEQLPTQTLSK